MFLASAFDGDGFASAERSRVVAPDLASRFHGYLAHAPEVAPGFHTDGVWVWPSVLADQVRDRAALPQRQLTEHILKRWVLLPDRLDDEVLTRARAARDQLPVPDPPVTLPWTYYRRPPRRHVSPGDLAAQCTDETGRIRYRSFDPRSGWGPTHAYRGAGTNFAGSSHYEVVSAFDAAGIADGFAAAEQALMLDQFRESVPTPGGGPRLARVFDQAAGFSPDRLRIPEPARRERLARCLLGGSLVLRVRGGLPDPLGGGKLSPSFRTDGVWVWQEALAEIVRRHGIAPELELLCHLERRALLPPQPVGFAAIGEARAVVEAGPPPSPQRPVRYYAFLPELARRASVEPILWRDSASEYSLLGDLRWHPSREDAGHGDLPVDVALTVAAGSAARLVDERLAAGRARPPILHWFR